MPDNTQASFPDSVSAYSVLNYSATFVRFSCFSIHCLLPSTISKGLMPLRTATNKKIIVTEVMVGYVAYGCSSITVTVKWVGFYKELFKSKYYFTGK
jgi:hypothetical protein